MSKTRRKFSAKFKADLVIEIVSFGKAVDSAVLHSRICL